MMNCRGMGAVTKKGNKPIVMAEGKKIPSSVQRSNAAKQASRASMDTVSAKKLEMPVIPEQAKYPSYIEETGEERVVGPRMAKGKKVPSKMMGGKMVPAYKKGKTVKRKMKGKSC